MRKKRKSTILYADIFYNTLTFLNFNTYFEARKPICRLQAIKKTVQVLEISSIR